MTVPHSSPFCLQGQIDWRGWGGDFYNLHLWRNFPLLKRTDFNELGKGKVKVIVSAKNMLDYESIFMMTCSTSYLSLLTVTGSRSSVELKRWHPSGQLTPSGRIKAARMGGQTRFWGSGHTFSSLTVSPTAFSLASLAHFVLISEVGNSAEESQLKNYEKGNKIHWRENWTLGGWPCASCQGLSVQSVLI